MYGWPPLSSCPVCARAAISIARSRVAIALSLRSATSNLVGNGRRHSDVQRVQGVHQVVEVVLRALLLVRLALRDAYGQADRVPSIGHQFPVALLGCDIDGVV